MIITKADLKSNIYQEILDEIIRQDDEIAQTAIEAAIDEAQMYLNKFDIVALFGTADTAPTMSSPALKDWVKDIACWKLIKLSNPAIDIELLRDNYKFAIQALSKIQSGDATPNGWPYRPDDPATEYDESQQICWSSNRKRHNHY